MKIWIFEFYGIFLNFILIFYVFFGFNSLLKPQKRVILIMWDPWSWRGATRTHGGATRAHVDTRELLRGARRLWAGKWWAHKLVGQSKYFGAYLAHMGDAPLKGVPHYIPVKLLYLSACGTNLLLRFFKTRGIVWPIGSIQANQDALIWWISVNRININAHD